MKKLKFLLLFAVLVGCVSISYAMESITPMPALSVPGQIPVSSTQDAITPGDAAKFIGQKKTVCGKVGSTHFAPKREGQPTFIDFEKPYPNQVFTGFIWGSDRGKFKTPPEMLYSGKEICVTGMIESYEDRPAIVVKDPSQISFR